MGVGDNYIPLIALVTGFVAVIYTSLGGLRAVVITDFIQTVLLYGGALLVLATISWDLGGFGWIPTKWDPAWDTQPIFSTDLSVRVTVVGTLLNYVVWYVCTAGGDQTSVQRFMATKDTKAARRAYATQLVTSVVVGVTLGLVGFALLGYFHAHPERLPEGMSLSENADKVFPHFIAFHLPVGISGLVVAAMFAAAMSSIDSGVNSITAVVMTDGLDRFGFKPKSDRSHVMIARCLAFGIGARRCAGKFCDGTGTWKHNRGHNQDIELADHTNLWVVLLRFVRSLCQFARRLDRSDLRHSHGCSDCILGTHFWLCARHRSVGSNQLPVDFSSGDYRQHCDRLYW